MKPEWYGAPAKRDRCYVVFNKRDTVRFSEPITTESVAAAFGMTAVLSLDDFYAAPEEHVAMHARDIIDAAGLVLSDADIAMLARGQDIVNSPSAPIASWKDLIQHKWPAYHGHLVSALEERLRMAERGQLNLEELVRVNATQPVPPPMHRTVKHRDTFEIRTV
jgi:hypothetical protein